MFTPGWTEVPWQEKQEGDSPLIHRGSFTWRNHVSKKHDLEPSENNHPTQNIHDLGLKIHVKFFPGFETKFVRQCDFSHEKLEN